MGVHITCQFPEGDLRVSPDKALAMLATRPLPLVSVWYPISHWRPGQVLLVHYPLVFPPDLTSGECTLWLRLVSKIQDSPCVIALTCL